MRNSNLTPWENHFDFHLSQDFYYLKGRGSKIELVFDILNVSNLLNKNWGTSYSSVYNIDLLQVNNVTPDASGNMIGDFSFFNNAPVVSDIESRWHAQIGVRVTF